MKTSVHQDTKPRPAVPTTVPEAPQPCAAKPQCCGVNVGIPQVHVESLSPHVTVLRAAAPGR